MVLARQRVCWSLLLLLALPLVLVRADPTAKLTPLTEADILKLMEYQIRDDAISERIDKGGLAFKVDDAVLRRLKEAGASDRIVAALRGEPGSDKKGSEPVKANMMVMVHCAIPSREVPLRTELSINDQVVDVFSSPTHKAIDKYLKYGWNTLTFKTAPEQGAGADNRLTFTFGPVHQDSKNDQLVQGPVLWEFNNETDWAFKNGKWSHPLGPNTREVTLSNRVYFSELEREKTEVKAGDYVLEARPDIPLRNVPVTVTVFVNGTPLTTYMLHDRQSVITPLLKQGKNEIKFVSRRVKDSIAPGDLKLEVRGPAEYSVGKEEFRAKAIVQRGGLAGWERHKETGQLVNKVNPEEEEVEYVTTFILDETPKARGK